VRDIDTFHMVSQENGAGNTELSPLEQCLVYAGELLGRPVTLSTLQSVYMDVDGGFGVKELIDAARRAGILAAFGKLALDKLDPQILPVILLQDDGRAVVVEALEGKDRYVVYDPAHGDGSAVLTRSQLAGQDYSGYALLLRAECRRDGQSETASSGHWFWSALAANRWLYVQVALAAVVANVLGLVTSIFSMVVYDRILPNEAVESLIALTAGVGIALVFDFLIRTLRAGFVDRAGQRADMVIGRHIFDRLLEMKMQARGGSTGSIAHTLREFETLRDFFTSATLVAVVDLPFIALFVFVIYLIGGPLALVPAVAVPVVLFTGVAVQPLLSRLAERSMADGQSKQSVLVETISGLEAIKSVGAARQMRARWDDAVSRQAEHGVRSRAVGQFALNITAFVQQVAQVMTIFVGVFLITKGLLSMGALIASVILTGRALAPLAQLAQTMTRFNQARASYKALNALMRADSERPDGRSWLSRPNLNGRITFEDVHFSYPGAMSESLSGVNFTIEKGEKVAILGRIGSGKSTVARLILGLYAPDKGAVRVDDTDIRQIDPGDLRRNIGAVLQDVWLFSGSVRDNIAIGALRPRDEDILEASRIAGVDEFISQNPSGYDLQVAERGEGLSGGQRQAITLARALIGRPPILLLDEPTAAMDVQKEAEVIDRLSQDMEDRTLIVVTHRTSLLKLVDRVIVLDRGRVVADGDKSLLSRGTPASKGGQQ